MMEKFSVREAVAAINLNMKAWERDDNRTSLLLNQVTEGWTVPINSIAWWSDKECQEAEVWAWHCLEWLAIGSDVKPAILSQIARCRPQQPQIDAAAS